MKDFKVSGRIDSSNSDELEDKLQQFLAGLDDANQVSIDAEELEYISSSGLRVLLRLSKKVKSVIMKNVNDEVYEILNVTGFTEIVSVERKLRDISIEGCELIGKGAHGEVYRLAPDTIVKVYNQGTDLNHVKKERETARWAFVKGVPTAITHDIVRDGDRYGAIFEMIDAKPSTEYVLESDENLHNFCCQVVSMLNQIHEIEVEPGILPDMREMTLDWVKNISDLFPSDIYDKLIKEIENIPKRNTLLHADSHLKNIFLCNDECMLIDMDTMCVGDPIFELATMYNSYVEFPSIDSKAAEFLGIDVSQARALWDGIFDCYMGDADDGERMKTLRRCIILGCVRIIDYMNRHDDHAVRDACINKCVLDISSTITFS